MGVLHGARRGSRLQGQAHHRAAPASGSATNGMRDEKNTGSSSTEPAASRWTATSSTSSPGAAVDVPVQAAHRIANTGTAEPLVFIEVQRGDYFGEDDIVRLEDDFGRAGDAA